VALRAAQVALRAVQVAQVALRAVQVAQVAQVALRAVQVALRAVLPLLRHLLPTTSSRYKAAPEAPHKKPTFSATRRNRLGFTPLPSTTRSSICSC